MRGVLKYEKAVYKKKGRPDKEVVLVDVANDPAWNGPNCRSDEVRDFLLIYTDLYLVLD